MLLDYLYWNQFWQFFLETYSLKLIHWTKFLAIISFLTMWYILHKCNIHWKNYLSINLGICLLASIYHSIYFSAYSHLSVYSYLCIHVWRKIEKTSIYLSIYLSIHTYLSLYLYFCLFTSVCLFTSMYPSMEKNWKTSINLSIYGEKLTYKVIQSEEFHVKESRHCNISVLIKLLSGFSKNNLEYR